MRRTESMMLLSYDTQQERYNRVQTYKGTFFPIRFKSSLKSFYEPLQIIF
jgi:hypothetical protein